MNPPSWESARHLLAEFDGSATEIFVIDLPLSQLPVAVTALAGLPSLEVTSFEDEVLGEPEAFDAAWRSRFQSPPSRTCQRSLRSANGTAWHLQIYLWLDATASELELELVFWNDLTFPPGLPIEEREERIQALVSLAEACRSGVHGARCILAPEHNKPAELLLGAPGVVVW